MEDAPDLDDATLDALERQNAPFDPGKCRVCGSDLEVQAMGPGSYISWAHARPEGVKWEDWHYGESRVETHHNGDSRILRLVAEVRRRRLSDDARPGGAS